MFISHRQVTDALTSICLAFIQNVLLCGALLLVDDSKEYVRGRFRSIYLFLSTAGTLYVSLNLMQLLSNKDDYAWAQKLINE